MIKTKKTLQELTLNDGSHTIILYNGGENPEDIHEDLVRFLEFTRKDLVESEILSEDAYIKTLQESIRKIKSNREMGERYMTLQDILTAEQAALTLGISVEEFREKLEEPETVEA